MDLLIITGMSGAGKSRVSSILEDKNFYCVDNMPVSLMPKFAELCVASHGRYELVALVADTRTTTDIGELLSALDDVRAVGVGLRILFVEAEVRTIVKRYKETRRGHPLDPEGTNLGASVEQEIELLQPLRDRADHIIDTTNLTPHSLERRITDVLFPNHDFKKLGINVKSFGFMHGIPIEADLVFDVRFLPNPYYITHMRNQTGMDDEVFKFVMGFEETTLFLEKLYELLDFLLLQYTEEGRKSLSICIGCTGGRHRSVSVARALHEHLQQSGFAVDCVHRDALR